MIETAATAPPGTSPAATGPADAGPADAAAGLAALIPRIAAISGPGSVITDPLQLRTYECDGLTAHRCSPGLVVLPESAQQVAAIVRACAQAKVPFVARGSGTGLSGGALPRGDGVLIVLTRMRNIIAIDPASRRAIVEPGVTNLAVSKAAAPFGLFYAPDPSSQVICSVGGNVAENSGGAHCLKHGFTVHHVTGLEIVTPQGELTWLGDGTGAAPGYDLLGVFTGSEGTLGIVTKIIVKLMRIPESVTTLLAAFTTMGAGGTASSNSTSGCRLPSPAWKTFATLTPEAADSSVIASSTCGSAVRGTTPSWTM
jgi:glycolate oxidase